MASYFIPLWLGAAVIGFGSLLVMISGYGPWASYFAALPLCMIAGKVTMVPCILRPKLWWAWGQAFFLLLPISCYDVFVSKDLSILTFAGFVLLWLSGFCGAWFYHRATTF